MAPSVFLQVDKLLNDLELVSLRDVGAWQLDSGYKRKLCLAIALINGPKVDYIRVLYLLR